MKKSTLFLACFFVFLFHKNAITAQSIGQLDKNFGSNGVVTANFNDTLNVSSTLTALQPDRKIIGLFTTTPNISNNLTFQIILFRLNENGSFDNSFGNEGKIYLPSLGYRDRLCGLMLQPDGKIIAATSLKTSRFNTDGTLDTSFTPIVDANCDQVILQPNGKILMLSVVYSNMACEDNSYTFSQFNSDGSKDTRYSGFVFSDGFYWVRMSEDGKVRFCYDIKHQAIGKLLANGTTKELFQLPTIPNLGQWRSYEAQILSDGKILLGGYVILNGAGDKSKFLLVRLLTDGKLDTAFGDGGFVATSFGDNTSNRTHSITLQTDGKIIIHGAGFLDGVYKNVLMRHYADGKIDTTFAAKGKLILGTYNSGVSKESIETIALASDGKLIVAGRNSGNSTTNINSYFVARYMTTENLGTIDFSVEDNSISIYPNPVRGEIKLEYTLNEAEDLSIQLLDVQGRVAQNLASNQHQEKGKHEQLLSVSSDLPTGEYYIVLSSLKGQKAVKILLQK